MRNDHSFVARIMAGLGRTTCIIPDLPSHILSPAISDEDYSRFMMNLTSHSAGFTHLFKLFNCNNLIIYETMRRVKHMISIHKKSTANSIDIVLNTGKKEALRDMLNQVVVSISSSQLQLCSVIGLKQALSCMNWREICRERCKSCCG